MSDDYTKVDPSKFAYTPPVPAIEKPISGGPRTIKPGEGSGSGTSIAPGIVKRIT